MINSYQGQGTQDLSGHRHEPQLNVACDGLPVSHYQHADSRRITEPGARHVGYDGADTGCKSGTKLLANTVGVGDIDLGWQSDHNRLGPALRTMHQQLTSEKQCSGSGVRPRSDSGVRPRLLAAIRQDRLATTRLAAD
jgi:hypothetical protein